METNKIPDDKLREHTEELLFQYDLVRSDIADIVWNMEHGNVDRIEGLLDNFISALTYLNGISMDCETYLRDNKVEIMKNIKEEWLKEEI